MIQSMKKVFLMLMVAVAFMACENVPGGNSGVPTKDAKAVAASTSGAVELLGKDAAAVDKALLAAGYEKVEMTYNAAPARLKKAFKDETNATYYYVFGYPKNVEKMTEEELYKYQQELFGKGGAMSIVYVTFENNVLSNMQTQVAVGMSKKTNLLYTDISDLLFAELPKTDSLRQWRGAVYGAGEDGENQFTDHAAYVAKVAATNGIEAQEMGEGLYPETKTAKGYYALWYAPDPENPQPVRVIAADNDSATTEEPTNNEVLYAMGMFSVAQSAYEPEEKPTGDFSITFSVTDVTAVSAHVAVIPSDTSVFYFTSYVSKAGLEEYEMTLEEYAADDMDYYPSAGYSFDDLASKGTMAADVTGLLPQQEYYVYAFQFNEDFEIIGKVFYTTFTTPAVEVKQTVALDLTDAEYYWDFDDTYGDGTLYLYGVDEAKNLEVSFFFLSETQNGTFTAENLYEPYAAWGFTLNSVTDISSEEGESSQFVDAEVTGALNADGTYTFGGYAVSAEGVKYTFENVVAAEYEEDEDDYEFAPKRAAKQARAKKQAHLLKK